MARPPNADGQRTRQAILDAALALFAEKGYFGTSLRDVAHAVGVRESARYNYFPGKEALFEALLAAQSAVKVERLAAILDAPLTDGRAVLDELAVFLLDRFVVPRQQQLFRILMSDGLRLARDGRINLLERMQTTAVIVSHDLRDAIAIADDLVVMERGRVLQSGALPFVVSHPASTSVARMLGYVTIVSGKVDAGRVIEREVEGDARGGGALLERFQGAAAGCGRMLPATDPSGEKHEVSPSRSRRRAQRGRDGQRR